MRVSEVDRLSEWRVEQSNSLSIYTTDIHTQTLLVYHIKETLRFESCPSCCGFFGRRLVVMRKFVSWSKRRGGLRGDDRESGALDRFRAALPQIVGVALCRQ